MGRVWMLVGALLGGSAVAMAAIAAHALPQRLDTKALGAVQSAIQMQGWHALALVLTGMWVIRAAPLAHALGNAAGWGFALGTLLFCGAIYGHHLADLRPGPVAPIGGVVLMVAWVLLAASAWAAGPTP